MLEVIPSVVAHNLEELNQKINILENFSPWAHLDVTDGRFAANLTWQNCGDLEILAGRIKIEAHLMIEKPEEALTEWRRVADRVIVHAEATDYLDEMVEGTTSSGPELGVALLLETPLEKITKLLPQIKFVHLMSIEKIGYHSEPFNDKIIGKIEALRHLAPSAVVSVDGGVNANNLPRLMAAGAQRFIVGSAIWGRSAPGLAFEKLVKIIS